MVTLRQPTAHVYVVACHARERVFQSPTSDKILWVALSDSQIPLLAIIGTMSDGANESKSTSGFRTPEEHRSAYYI